jgi:putative oxidoreductase
MDVSLLLLHVIVGLLFVGHGAQKLFGAFGGYGLEGTGGYFESIGLRPGKLHAFAAGTAEFAGGILLTLGLLLPLAAALIAATMTAAILTVHLPKGIWNHEGGLEYNLVLILLVLTLVAVGGGEYALDEALNLDLTSAAWAFGSVGAGVLGGIGAVLSGRLAPAGQGGEAHAQSA